MAEEIGIVMSLYDKVSPTLKSISNNSKAFDKTLQELEQACDTYDKEQERLTKNLSTLKSKLTESNEKVKDATSAWRKHKDELTKSVMTKAIEEQAGYKKSLTDTEAALKSNRKAITDYVSEVRKAENSGAGSGLGGGLGESALLGKLKNAGLFKLAGDAGTQLAGAVFESALGQPAAEAASSILSGIISGASMGAMTGTPHGIAIGAVVGAGAGIANAVTAIGKAQDDVFKSYVQEQAEGQLSARASDITGGSSIAGQREQDTIAFNTLLGAGRGDDYLTKLRTLAADTPMEYGDLTTMSRSLATGFKDDPERMLELMRDIGDAGSALGVDASGMNTMATAMSRMQSSGKVSLEYLNLIQERGVDAVGMLADGLGISKSTVYDRISKGAIDGANAVDILQEKMRELFGGSMDAQSKTFSGLSSTLEDAQKEMQNAYGEGYNAERGKGIKEQTDWLSGVSGEAQQEANKAIGAWQASLENSKEQAIRDAVDDAMATDEYRQAKAAGDAAEMGRILMAAKVKGQSEYNASEGAQLALESELSLAASIRDDADSNNAYWNAGYRKSQEYSKGLAAGILAGYAADFAASGGTLANGGYYDAMGNYQPGQPPAFAYGLNRVPYDNFPALLHEGERVQTAGQARQQDSGGTSGITIDVHDCSFAGSTQEQAEQLIKIVAEGVTRASALRVP